MVRAAQRTKRETQHCSVLDQQPPLGKAGGVVRNRGRAGGQRAGGHCCSSGSCRHFSLLHSARGSELGAWSRPTLLRPSFHFRSSKTPTDSANYPPKRSCAPCLLGIFINAKLICLIQQVVDGSDQSVGLGH